MQSRKYRDKEWLRKKYVDEDLSLSDIGDICGVTDDTVNRWTKKYDLSPDQKHRNKDWLEDKLRSDLSYSEISEKYNVGITTIQVWKEKHDIEIETPDYRRSEWLREKWREEDLSLQEICDESDHDITIGSVSMWKDKHGIKKKHHDPEWLEQKYIDEGLSTIKIGELIDRNPETIANNLRKNGIELATHQNKFEKYEAPWQGITGENHPGSKMTGDDHPCYMGLDNGNMWRRSGRWKSLKPLIRKRDQYTCELCEEFGKQVHHITPVSVGGPKFDPDNLTTLCIDCHQDVHWNTHLRNYRIPEDSHQPDDDAWITDAVYN